MPIIAPLIGGVLGAWLYSITVGVHIPSEIDDLEEKVRQLQFDKNLNQHMYTKKTNINDTENKHLLSNSSDEIKNYYKNIQ